MRSDYSSSKRSIFVFVAAFVIVMAIAILNQFVFKSPQYADVAIPTYSERQVENSPDDSQAIPNSDLENDSLKEEPASELEMPANESVTEPSPIPETPVNSTPNKLENQAYPITILPRPTEVLNAITSPYYIPKQKIVEIDPSNYGERSTQDVDGNPLYNPIIIVLHETVASAQSAINTFQNHHAEDNNQVSYHVLIELDGSIIYLVPPEMRAFGAGNSVFEGPYGSETVKLDAELAPSVNNFAYHVSLETPDDGRDKDSTHSGYTVWQYYSLAWLIAQSNVPLERITTHKAVDRSGTRQDPRSFDFNQFQQLLQAYRGQNA